MNTVPVRRLRGPRGGGFVDPAGPHVWHRSCSVPHRRL